MLILFCSNFVLKLMLGFALICFSLIVCSALAKSGLPLGKQAPTLGPIKILNFEPTPEYFYENFVQRSQPVLIRTKNKSWQRYSKKFSDLDFLKKYVDNIFGKVYKRNIWAQGWPVETRMSFKKFSKEASQSKALYWDARFPLKGELLKHIPLPFSIRCELFKKWIQSAVLLCNYRNSSSVFHQDAAENFFFQISGKKTWLIANYSHSAHVYANQYNLQPGLSPIDPENVDLEKFPLAEKIKFYEITIEPGDFLYVPEMWWHHVRSHGAPNVALGVWSEIFNQPEESELSDVEEYTEEFSRIRQATPNLLDCPWQHISLYDLEHKDSRNLLSSFNPIYEENNLLYFGSDEGSFYCVNSTDGSVVWKFSVEGDAGSSPVLSSDGKRVYFADEKSLVYAFSAESGVVLWKYELNDGVVAALRLSKNGNVLYVASLDQQIYAINESVGSLLWKQGPLHGEIWSSPIMVHDNLIICVCEDEIDFSVYYINARNGKIKWKYPTNSAVFSTPTVDPKNKNAFVLDQNGKLHVLNITNGELLKSFETDEECLASPVFNSNLNRLYFISRSGKMFCFDAATLKVIWTVNFELNDDDSVLSSPLLYLPTNVLYQAAGRYLYAINSYSGEVVWKFLAGAELIASPRMDKNEQIYIGSTDNKLYAIDGKSGTIKWFFKNSGPIVSSVAMSETFHNTFTVGALL